jgi:hypothetical protein
MGLRRLLRESAFQMARRDVAYLLRDHEADLLRVFREEMQRLDDEIPEEALFIDIKMVPLGEMMLKAALRAMSRFLLEEGAPPPDSAQPPAA